MSGEITREQFRELHPSLARLFDSLQKAIEQFDDNMASVTGTLGYTLDCGTPLNVSITIGEDEEGDECE